MSGHAHGHTHNGEACSGHGHGHSQPIVDSSPGDFTLELGEDTAAPPSLNIGASMDEGNEPEGPHRHGPNCGHMAIEHGDHIGFVVDGVMECFERGDHEIKDLCFEKHQGLQPSPGKGCCHEEEEQSHLHAHVAGTCRNSQEKVVLMRVAGDSCVLPVTEDLHTSCDGTHVDLGDHVHGEGCGHEMIQHGDHVDYIVKTKGGGLQLHHVHTLADGSKHTDVHGSVASVQVERSPLLAGRPTKGSHTPGGTAISKEWRFRVDFGVPPEMFRIPSVGAAESVKIDMPVKDLHEPVDTTLFVEGICCPSEVPLIESILNPLPGVESVKVNVPARTTHVRHIPALTQPEALADALNGASLGAFVQKATDKMNTSTPLPPWNVLLCGVLWIVSLFHYMESVEGAEWTGNLKYVAIAAIVLGLPPIAIKAFGSVQRFVLDINTLMTLAVAGAIAIGDYAEGAAVVFLFAISEYLETRSSEKARDAIASVMSLKPEMAELLSGEQVHVDAVALGSVLAVRPGEKVPIDGEVTKGSSTLDESSLTGESRPVNKAPGDSVLAGTINQTGYLEIRTTEVAENSAAARLVKLVSDAQTQRSPTEATVAAFARVYTPIMVLTAILMASVPWIWMDDEAAKEWVYQALVLLVVACPCALVISTPITYVCALACAAKRGILIKGGMHLETLGRITALALDKTGTLTQGSFQLTQLEMMNNGTKSGVLYHLGSVEAQTSHPMAVALVAAMKKEGIAGSQDVEGYATHAGEGISALVDGKMVEVGNARLAERAGWLGKIASQGHERAQAWEQMGGTVGFVAVDGVPQGMFSVSDAPRKEAKQAMEKLKALGVTTVMLTGDNQGSAEAIQEKVQVEEIHFQLRPEDKTQLVAEMKISYGAEVQDGCATCFSTSGGVGMVGDGINDAPALAAADIGLAMGAAGTAVAMETADCCLMDSNLTKIALAIELGRSCRQTIRENIVLSVITKIIMIALAVVGYGSLWLAIITDVGTMLLVTLNGMTVLNFGEEEQAPHAHSHGHSHGSGGGCCGDKPPAAAHGHSHGGVACAGHGGGHEEVHGHSHGGVPCSGHSEAPKAAHGHGHGGGDGGCCGDDHGPAAGSGHGDSHGDAHGHSHGAEPCIGHGAPAQGSGHGHGHGAAA